MFKKIIHTGDWHIRAKNNHDLFLKYIEMFFESVKNNMEKQGVDDDEVLIFIAGDLFHSKYLTHESLSTMYKALFPISKKYHIGIIIGNHDFNEKNKGQGDCISSVIELLQLSNETKPIVYSKSSEVIDIQNLRLFHFCDFDKENINFSEVDYNTSKVKIGVNHSPLNGSTLFNSRKIKEEGQYKNVNMFKGCDFAMLGDIHLAQQIPYDVPVYYCGSLYQQNYGEYPHGHGYRIWDVESKDSTFVEIDNIDTYVNIVVDNNFSNYNKK